MATRVTDIESSLWQAADQLRANSNLSAQEYSIPVLGLIFLRAAVRVTIEEWLDKLPAAYQPPLWDQKVTQVYEHIYDSYYGSGRSNYTRLAP